MSAASPALPPSPLNEDRKILLARLVDGLDGPSLWWLSGYTAGLAQGHAAPQLAVLPGGVPATAGAADPPPVGSSPADASRTSLIPPCAGAVKGSDSIRSPSTTAEARTAAPGVSLSNCARPSASVLTVSVSDPGTIRR